MKKVINNNKINKKDVYNSIKNASEILLIIFKKLDK